MDKYHSMKELQNETIENEDWEIITEDRDTRNDFGNTWWWN